MAATLAVLPAAAREAGPVAQMRPVKDRYGATTLIDNYRWMEALPNPELHAYEASAGAYAEGMLAHIPSRERMQHALAALESPTDSVPALAQDGDSIFYLRRGPPDDVARLYSRGVSGGAERLLVDPEMLADVKPHSEIGAFSPSPDGSYVAYIMADAGPDSAVLRILDVNHHTTLSERIGAARFAAVAWQADSGGFYYTRPVDSAAANPWHHLGIYQHRIGGAPEHDAKVLDAAKLPFTFHGQNVIPRLVLPPASDYALLLVSDGVSPEIAVYTAPVTQLAQQPAPWAALSAQGAGATQVSVSASLAFLLTSNAAPTFRVISEDLADPGLDHARTILPAVPDGVITAITASMDALYVARRQGLGMHLLRLDYQLPTPQDVALPYAGTIAAGATSELLRDTSFGRSPGLTADPRTPGAMFSLESWTHPRSWQHFDLHAHRAEDAQVGPPRTPPAEYETIETTAVARDGTHIPISLIARQGAAKDHTRPTVLEAYGSYGYADDPHYLPAAMAWADQGGVYAIAHVRGGGELGPPWHAAGQFAQKRNTITDYLSCADALVAQGYTSAAHLGGLGVNAGAIAVGGAVTWQPAALRAAAFHDGLLNPLRALDSGPPEAKIEFGNPHDPVQFADLLPIDAYSQIREGADYPAVLLTANETDDSAQAWQSAKMAARLQAATTSDRPVLLRPAGTRGTEADELAFLWWQLK